jgi:hypothetical protein
MQPLSIRLLRVFGELGKDRLDLHTLLESAGNDPADRRLVLDAIEELKREGMLEERSGDFYALTAKAKATAAARWSTLT